MMDYYILDYLSRPNGNSRLSIHKAKEGIRNTKRRK
jgi:hypothetical protein